MPVKGSNLPDLVRTATVAALADLTLAADDNGYALRDSSGVKVVAQTTFDPTGLPSLPCLVVTADRKQKEERLPGDTEYREYVLPFLCLLVDRRGSRDQQKDAQCRAWRKEIIDRFDQQRPITADVPPCQWCEVETQDVIEQKAAEFQMVESALRLNFRMREPRHTSR